MSVADRVEDARLLALQGRSEGALMNVLLAVAAASAAAYPEATKSTWRQKCRANEGPDACRFRMYLAPRLVHLIGGTPGAAESAFGVEFKGQHLDLETVLYKHYRCTLAHEGSLPSDVVWDPSDGESTTITIGSGNRLVLGGAWLRLLALAALDRMPADRTPPARKFRFVNRPMWVALEEDISRHRMVPSGIMALADALLRVDAATPQAATPEELQQSFSRLVECGWINEAALSFMRDAGAIYQRDHLTPKAFAMLREMAALVEFLP